jgi:hypothetical protein
MYFYAKQKAPSPQRDEALIRGTTLIDIKSTHNFNGKTVPSYYYNKYTYTSNGKLQRETSDDTSCRLISQSQMILPVRISAYLPLSKPLIFYLKKL